MQNTDQLRHAIDSGKTGDKVSVSDPAMAPLGTDDEAAGTPVTPQRLQHAADIRHTHTSENKKGWKIIAGVAVLLLLGFFLLD
jgi:hypothetical protein